MRSTLVILLQLLAAPQLLALSPRIAFERVLPAAHDLGPARDVAIVHAIGDTAAIETFVDYFIEKANHSGFLHVRDARRNTGPAEVYLAVKTFSCTSTVGEGEGSVRDYSGERVKRKQTWADAICTARIDVMAPDMKRISTFYGKGAGTSPRVETLSDDDRRYALHQAARYAGIDAAERITPRRVKEIILLDDQAPALDEALTLIDTGRLAEARKSWETALRQQPRSAPLHFNLGAICEALGDRKAASAHYQAARQLAPNETRYTSEMRLFERRQ